MKETVRTCVGCRGRSRPGELLRFTGGSTRSQMTEDVGAGAAAAAPGGTLRGEGDHLECDLFGRLPGRGAYCHLRTECVLRDECLVRLKQGVVGRGVLRKRGVAPGGRVRKQRRSGGSTEHGAAVVEIVQRALDALCDRQLTTREEARRDEVARFLKLLSAKLRGAAPAGAGRVARGSVAGAARAESRPEGKPEGENERETTHAPKNTRRGIRL